MAGWQRKRNERQCASLSPSRCSTTGRGTQPVAAYGSSCSPHGAAAVCVNLSLSPGGHLVGSAHPTTCAVPFVVSISRRCMATTAGHTASASAVAPSAAPAQDGTPITKGSVPEKYSTSAEAATWWPSRVEAAAGPSSAPGGGQTQLS